MTGQIGQCHEGGETNLDDVKNYGVSGRGRGGSRSFAIERKYEDEKTLLIQLRVTLTVPAVTFVRRTRLGPRGNRGNYA
jgi:hypothetical protein